jgi:hypothetical protein
VHTNTHAAIVYQYSLSTATYMIETDDVLAYSPAGALDAIVSHLQASGRTGLTVLIWAHGAVVADDVS